MSFLPVIGVVPVLVGPLQVLLAVLPALLVSLGGIFLALLKPSGFKKTLKLLWRLKLPLLAIIGIIFGLAWGVRAVLPGNTGNVSAAERNVADWPAFRGSPQRTGAVPGSPSPLRGGVNWAFTAADTKTFYASPAVAGNRVYITSAEKGVFVDRGAIYCLDADSGAVVWKSSPPGFRATFSSPAVSGKYLVCGEGLHYTRDGRVICLDVTQRGRLLWEFRAKSHVESSPCIANGRACIGAGDDGYYCFELEPDRAGQARVVWHVPGEQLPDAETSPITHDGKVYAGLGLGGRALVCLDAATGKELWRVPTPYPVFASPTIAAGRIFFGMGNGNFIETADQAAVKELEKLRKTGATPAQLAEAEKNLRAAGEVWAVDLKRASEAKPAGLVTNAVVWRYRVSEVVLDAIAADAERIYFGSRNGRFYCLSHDGRELGAYDARAAIMTSPAVTETHVYFVTDTGRLICLAKDSFQPVWESSLGTEGPFLSSPAAARGHIYVGTPNDGFLSVGSAAAGAQPVWAGFLGGAGRPGCLEAPNLPERGALLWRWPRPAGDSGAEPAPPAITAPAASLGKFLCLPIAGGAPKGILCLTNASESREAPESWRYPTTNGVSLSPGMAFVTATSAKPSAGPEPAVFFVDGRPGDPGRSLHCLRAADGSLLWRHPVDSDASGQFTLGASDALRDGVRGCLLTHDRADTVTCLDYSARVQWRQELGTPVGAPAIENNLAAIAIKLPATLAVLDLPTGGQLWKIRLAATTGPVLQGNRVYVGASNGLAAFELLDGSRLWTADSGAPIQPLVCAHGYIACPTVQGAVLVKAKDGAVLAKIPQAEAILPPVLTRNALLYGTKDALMLYDIASGKAQRWMATGWLGAFSSPLIMENTSVYFATDQKGFIRAGKR